MRVSNKVYVINKRGQPLMPCSIVKARKLLKNGKAKVFKKYPFTIQLLVATGETKQDISLGIDSGYKNIGFSATTEKEELISGTLILDGKTKDRLTEKRMYRRGRRNKLRYRKPRFLNRKRNTDWLPPSIQRRYNTHISLIERIKKIIPVTKVTVEVANFDIQKLNNPEIEGVGYQQGNLYGYQNVRSFLLSREKGLCQLCGKEFSRTNSSHIHHVKTRSKGGTDRPCNLALLHENCHEKLHKKGLYDSLKKNKEYKESTFMSIIHKMFWKDIPDLKVTFGYITFLKRQEYNIEKSHSNDAFVISGGFNHKRCKPIEVIQKHRNSRVLQLNRKGFKPSIRKQRYKIQPNDIFWVKGVNYICKGVFSYGKYILFGDMKKKEYFKMEQVERYYNFGGLVWNMM